MYIFVKTQKEALPVLQTLLYSKKSTSFALLVFEPFFNTNNKASVFVFVFFFGKTTPRICFRLSLCVFFPELTPMHSRKTFACLRLPRRHTHTHSHTATHARIALTKFKAEDARRGSTEPQAHARGAVGRVGVQVALSQCARGGQPRQCPQRAPPPHGVGLQLWRHRGWPTAPLSRRHLVCTSIHWHTLAHSHPSIGTHKHPSISSHIHPLAHTHTSTHPHK